MKLLLFGKIGSGKSFVGELLQRDHGIPYHDADLDLPESMKEVIRRHEPITEEMRDAFVDRIVARMRSLSHEHADFCVAQALFKNRHRERILAAFPDLTMVWVQSTDEFVEARLRERTSHLASRYYAQQVNPQFEAPTHAHEVIENSANLAFLHSQLDSLLTAIRRAHPPRFKALLFDLDGTLVDSLAMVQNVMETWCRRHGIPFEKALEVCHGGRTVDTVALLAPHLCARKEAKEIERMEDAASGSLMPIAGAAHFLASLQAVPWAIVTSSNLEAATLKLSVCGLPKPPILITAESVTQGKPHPEPFLLAAEKLGVAPAECLVFEDADNGVNSALAAGCHVMLVGQGCAIEHPGIVGRLADFTGYSLSQDDALTDGDRLVSIISAPNVLP